MAERSLLKGADEKGPLKPGTCAQIPPSGQRQRHGHRIQSECLCELTGAVGGDGRADGRVGGSCSGGLAAPGCATCAWGGGGACR